MVPWTALSIAIPALMSMFGGGGNSFMKAKPDYDAAEILKGLEKQYAVKEPSRAKK